VPLTAEARVNQGIAPKAAVERAARTGEPVEAAARAQNASGTAPAAASSTVEQRATSTGHRAASAEHRASSNGAADHPHNGTNRDPGALKKLLWTGLAAGSIAVAGVAARRTSSAIWGAVLREPPPSSKA
jgi:hypothetical protein